MAVSDAMLALSLAQIGFVTLMLITQIRLWKIVAGAGVILTGISSVMIEDSVPMFLFAGIGIIWGFITISEQIAQAMGTKQDSSNEGWW